MIRQYELVERVRAYDPQADEALLNKAYVFSLKAHGSQLRASGDPYFSHPLEVAGILTEMKLDVDTICTALLHDTIEDTVATYEQIQKLFGEKIAQMVDGVTKLSRLERPDSESQRQAENFRKLLLAMSNDIRVLLVKLADRLHNMRTLHFIKAPEKRKRIALETMEIYAPLAERIGMEQMKEELQDLAFAQLNPDALASINTRLEFLRSQGGRLVPAITEQLHRTLLAGGCDCTIQGREKRPYSIWKKMESKNISFEQLSDVMAFRVVVGDIGDCYRALGSIHAAYPMVPGRFKDYISTPKRNGYKSLHTTVIGPERQKIEVQIRTREMHEIAELGVAAHWSYKQGRPVDTDGVQYRWLRELLEILEHASTPEEFLEHTKLEMFPDQVFCFTPKGDLIALPKGATPLDFAYAVHTSVGHTCVGAKVNGRLQPLRTLLQNGDQVEIVRSKAQTPNPDWENLVVTGHARSAIRRFLRAQQREQYLALGRDIVIKAFQSADHDVKEKSLDKQVEGALKIFRQRSADDLFVAVGQGNLTGRAVVEALFPGDKLREQGKVVPLGRPKAEKTAKGRGVPIKGLIPGMAIHYAGCCHPLPGDRIVGIVQTGRGVTIHAIDCKTLEQYNDQPERWLDLAWSHEDSDNQPYIGRISAVVLNEPGTLSAVATVIAKNLGNIANLNFTERTSDYVEMVIDIEVRDVKHLTSIVAALRANPAISSVERARG